ncbi:hypothetical protein B0I10_11613 [Flavobacterium lacus]|jgi:hypothetical protein|uniref:Uncharacterized protein n=1 Tax=Flavobacterium lacus TaxID=1353778 RepID=A0A328WK54_9FLAO|nr:hypothetical protein B0I10_11613 [Flavobacterium lacus]
MLFNSIEFFVLLSLVFVLYVLLQKQKLAWQNGLLLVANDYLYGCWYWRFLFSQIRGKDFHTTNELNNNTQQVYFTF